ncbi:MAG: hypothetical protein K8I00_05150 [Candidatus Omnitrophica bacterium]|nr:hypothetical protein [Candidatus Omnitrophota bacterium]
MYSLTLFVHSWGRWLLLAAMILLLIRSWRGWLGGGEADKKFHSTRLITMIVYDLQALIGYYLYVISPNVKVAFEPGVKFMADAQLRYIAVEHICAMSLGLIVLHVGNVLVKKAPDSKTAFKRMAITMTIIFVLVMASIPWPFMPYGRLLFRGF